MYEPLGNEGRLRETKIAVNKSKRNKTRRNISYRGNMSRE